MSDRLSLAFVLALVLGSGMGCLQASETPVASPSDPEPAADSAEPSVFGAWRVVAHHAPGISAMSGEQADAWIGRAARYEEGAATFGEEQCDEATYSVESADEDTFYSDFGVALSGIGADSSSVSVFDVQCEGESWTAPGSTLIVESSERAWTLWDGVFFELVR